MNRELPRLRVSVHPDKCIGAGHCVGCAPEIFSQNEDDGVVILLIEKPSVDRRAAVESAVRMCPTSAIEVQEI
jgi:ferredoxin